MRCERCKFENIPGQTTCIKCGSVLQITSSPLSIYPPRMPKWQKPFRNFSRLFRKSKTIAFINAKLHIPKWLQDLFSDQAIGLLLCLIPGLAHLINKRFKEIRLYFFAWLVLLLTGVFLYGGTAGYICIGLAIGLHVGITIQYGIFKNLNNIMEMAATVVMLIIGLTFVYRIVPDIFFPFITGGYSSLNIPYYNISEGDYLLARTGVDNHTIISRGTLVILHPAIIGNHQRYAARSNQTTTGQIVGLPEEKIEISKNVFIINGKPLDNEQYPVPEWLQGRTFSTIIAKDKYFVSLRYNVQAHNITLEDAYINQVCLVHTDDIEATVFMRWLPLHKRGFLR